MRASQNETPEMEHIRVQIEREERTLKQNTEKLQFKQKEYEDIKKQAGIKHQGELRTFESKQASELEAKTASENREIQKIQKEITETEQNINKLKEDLSKVSIEAERNARGQQKTKEEISRETRESISRNPEQLRINGQLQREERELDQLKRELQNQKSKLDRQQQQFKRQQQLDKEKLIKKQDRERNSFEDSWLREQKYYEAKIKVATSVKNRLELDYKSKERENDIALAQQKKAESEQNARFGSQKGKENFATGNDNPLQNAGRNRFRSPGRY